MHSGIVCLPASKIKHFALGPQNDDDVVVCVCVCVCVFVFFCVWFGE